MIVYGDLWTDSTNDFEHSNFSKRSVFSLTINITTEHLGLLN
jgi:hypothetical protein